MLPKLRALSALTVILIVCLTWAIGYWEGISSTGLGKGGAIVSQMPDLSELEERPTGYSAICGRPRDRDYADLCQQWRSAEAAGQTVWYSQLQLWLNVAGLLGLLATIGFSIRATGAALDSNRINRELGEAQVRAYVSWETCQVSVWWQQPGDKLAFIRLTPTIKNTGQSPANIVSLYSFLDVRDDVQMPSVVVDPIYAATEHELGAGNQFYFKEQDFGAEDAGAVFRREKRCFLLGWGRYRDVFWRAGDPERVIRFCFEVSLHSPPELVTKESGVGFVGLTAMADYQMGPAQ